mgnify:CR=1 FL=1
MDYKKFTKFHKIMCINFIMPYHYKKKTKIKQMPVQRLKKLNKDIEKQHTPQPEDPRKIDFKNNDEMGRLN